MFQEIGLWRNCTKPIVQSGSVCNNTKNTGVLCGRHMRERLSAARLWVEFLEDAVFSVGCDNG